MDLLEQLPNIQAPVTGAGEITHGPAGPVGCAPTACDVHDCLAMLVKHGDDTLGQLLERLDATIGRALEDREFTDETNGPA